MTPAPYSQNAVSSPTTTAPIDATGTGAGANTPALMALPVDSGSGLDGSRTSRKWYTFSVNLRETYDDNVNTTDTNQQASLETSLSPSILVDFPSVNGDFSARYTFGVIYYGDIGSGQGGGNTVINGGGGASNGSIDYTNEFDAQYTHSFSDRFQLSLSDDVRYYTDPDILQSTGTLFRNGPYIVNTFSGALSAQWTPLVGTSTSYSNTFTNYFNSDVAETQNGDENTFSQSVGFNILPKISVNLGGIYDDSSYDQASRGYTSYTGFFGTNWNALPNLSVSARAGGTYTETAESDIAGQPSKGSEGQLSPYAALSASWTLGARSTLSFDYSHEITPTDNQFANGQISDRFSSNITYAITPNISSHLSGVFTDANVTSTLAATTTQPAYSEYNYELDTGVSYRFTSYLSLDFDVSISGNDSEIEDRNYDRHTASVGLTGTY